MDDAFYVKDNYYYPDYNYGKKMSIVEEQINQESYRPDEEEDLKDNNSDNKDIFEEEEKINIHLIIFLLGSVIKNYQKNQVKMMRNQIILIYIKNIKKIIKIIERMEI